MSDTAKQVLDLKEAGNKFFSSGKYAEAVEKFTAALALEPENDSVLSNRSAAYIRLGAETPASLDLAVADARECIRLKPEWGKAYSRCGAALSAKKEFAEAVKVFAVGIGMDPSNKLLTDGLRAAQEALRVAKNPEEKEDYVIGIDLGTTNCCVAVWVGKKVEIVPNDRGLMTTPSFVGFDSKTAKRTVGQASKSLAAQHPTTTLYDVKRLIGQNLDAQGVEQDARRMAYPVTRGPDGAPVIEVTTQMNGTKKMAPEEVSGLLLAYLKKTAENYLKQPVSKAVITVPAYFNDAQRAATKAAGRIAGLEVLRIINEPTAAALSYGLDIKDKTEATNILIFDLGGGTFDVSLLSIHEGIFEVKATGGDTRLGGEDFDQRVVEFLLAEAEKQGLPDFNTDPRAMKRMHVEAEKAKRQLSQTQEAKIHLEALFKKGNDGKGLEFKYTLTREKFEKLNESLVQRSLETVAHVLKDANMDVKDVHEIVLVGGSTRIPKIQSELVALFNGKELCRSVNPDEAVAYGAAVQGAILNGKRSKATDNLLLLDVTPLSLGIETTGRVMSTIIPRNTPIPCVRTQQYTTEENYQTEVDISVFEGERSRTDENNELGKFSITGIERAKRGEPKIDVSFSLDSNGILSVKAVDLTTNAEARIEVASKGRASEKDIERMVADAEKYRQEDEQLRRRTEQRNELEGMLYESNELVTSGKGGSKASLTLEQTASQIQEWLDQSGDDSSAKEFSAKIREMERAIGKMKM